jgi:type VI secretion system protein ImpA
MVAAGSANRPSTNGNHLQTRDAALREVLRVADYFKRNEPHSPIAYHLEQAVRWAQMPLPELWAELIPDESTRAQLFRLVGINQPEQSS